ncbi:hypothetical protein ILUMI_09326 [Ignelater luminosus]|uniref:HTH psq-type domain-containing protein n=1 Tax=Ignelater luminosus TaxID=2038154 RepID=A0A8K0G9S4_IGNLU|nr:hypothetical protein ILUMI_09326 [Ignelater luminosus]
MPQNRIRTTEHRSYSDDQLLLAVKQVSEEHKSARYVAKVTGIPRATLNRYVVKVAEFGLENVNFNPGSDRLKIFTMEQEIWLVNYIKHACLIHFGLSTKASRRLDFEFANANNVAIHDGWKSNKMAASPSGWMVSDLSPGLPLVVDAVVSPEEIRPHPKAPPRKGARNIKKKRSAILTDTPTEKALEEEAAKRNDKRNEKSMVYTSVVGVDRTSHGAPPESLQPESPLGTTSKPLTLSPPSHNGILSGVVSFKARETSRAGPSLDCREAEAALSRCTLPKTFLRVATCTSTHCRDEESRYHRFPLGRDGFLFIRRV